MRKINFVEEIKKRYPYYRDINFFKQPQSNWFNFYSNRIDLFIYIGDISIHIVVDEDRMSVYSYAIKTKHTWRGIRLTKEEFLHKLKEINLRKQFDKLISEPS